jgi:hypothetical protein
MAIPHFTIPLSFDRGAAVVCDQDSADEVVSCVLSVLLCPLHFRAELPEFGIADPTFSMGHVDLEVIADAVRQWEPRASMVMAQRPDLLDELIAYVTATTSAPTTD